jgi:hypothetical protein
MASEEKGKRKTPTPTTTEGPIDDSFWFALSKDWTKNNISNLDADAAKIQTILGWLWGVYTAGASIGIDLSKLSYPLWVNILIGLPSVALILGYWLAGWAQMPAGLSQEKDEPSSVDKYQFDPTFPAEIKGVYKDIIKTKRSRLLKVLVTSGVAALLVVAAVAAASFNHQASATNFMAMVSSQNGKDTIRINGHLPDDTQVTVIVVTPLTSGGSSVLKELPYMTSSAGDIQANIGLDSMSQEYTITLEWQQADSMMVTLQRFIT